MSRPCFRAWRRAGRRAALAGGHCFLKECECCWIFFDQGPLGQRVLSETLEQVGAGRSQAFVETAHYFGDARLNSVQVQALLVAEIMKQQSLADVSCLDDMIRRGSQVAICSEFTDRCSDQSGPPVVSDGPVR